MLAGGTAAYLHFSQPVVEPPRQIELNEAQKKQIKDLLDVAEIHFEMGYITAPSGANALWAYQEILKTDPYNDAAIAGLKKIAGEMEQQGWALFEKGQRAQALEKVNDGLEADPKHEGLLKLKEKLTR
jgi:hypothetical protein